MFMEVDSVSTALLRSIPLFDDLSAQHQEQIVQFSHLCSFLEGKEIFHEGDPQDYLYVVLEGRVALEIHIPNHGKLRILTVEPLEMLGWSSMADVAPKRTATARAVTPTKLLATDAAQLHKACLEDSKLGFVIMHHVTNVIASRLLVTRMQLIDMFANPSSEASHG
jgi:CRP-like cAMP-binding protein